MTDPIDVAISAVFGGVGAVLGMFALIVVVHADEFLCRAVWVDEATRTDKVATTVRILPHWINDRTDWRAFASVLPKAALAGAVLAATVDIFITGIRVVFLT